MNDDTRRITCVVADDHAHMCQAIVACLRMEPDVELLGTASDGEALLELLATEQPDVVIADAHMPRRDGIEVCREVAARFPDVRVILHTGRDDVALLEEALQAGARGFLVKSGSPAELVRTLRVVVGGRTYVDGSLVDSLLRRQSRRQPDPFSGIELEILGLLAEGRTTEEIAEELRLPAESVVSGARSAARKLDGDAHDDGITRSLRLALAGLTPDRGLHRRC